MFFAALLWIGEATPLVVNLVEEKDCCVESTSTCYSSDYQSHILHENRGNCLLDCNEANTLSNDHICCTWACSRRGHCGCACHSSCCIVEEDHNRSCFDSDSQLWNCCNRNDCCCSYDWSRSYYRVRRSVSGNKNASGSENESENRNGNANVILNESKNENENENVNKRRNENENVSEKKSKTWHESGTIDYFDFWSGSVHRI